MKGLESSDFRSIAINVVSSFVWFLLGISVGLTSKWLRGLFTRRRVKAANQKSFRNNSLITVSGSRFELTRSQLRLQITPDRFFLPFPADIRERMQNAVPDFDFRTPTMTDRVAQLRTEALALIPDLEEILTACQIEVAQNLIERAQRLERIFNGLLFHPIKMNTSATADVEEQPLVNVDFYTTDYFTHQVIHRAFTKIRSRRPVEDLLAKAYVPRPLWFFLNGFGLNCLVCATPDRTSPAPGLLVFGKRSERVGKNAASGTWHVTANEALSETDVEDQRLSVDRWIRRALDEEVGIREFEIIRSFVFSVTIGLEDMQPGLFCLVICEIAADSLQTRTLSSQDGSMEYETYQTIGFDQSSIAAALASGGLPERPEQTPTPFSPSAENILRNILARGTESLRP